MPTGVSSNNLVWFILWKKTDGSIGVEQEFYTLKECKELSKKLRSDVGRLYIPVDQFSDLLAEGKVQDFILKVVGSTGLSLWKK